METVENSRPQPAPTGQTLLRVLQSGILVYFGDHVIIQALPIQIVVTQMVLESRGIQQMEKFSCFVFGRQAATTGGFAIPSLILSILPTTIVNKPFHYLKMVLRFLEAR
jgi:hypothetical protein